MATAVTDIEAQGLARLQALRDGRQGKAAARTAVRQWMLEVGRASRDVARTSEAGVAKLHMPKHSSDVALVTAARLFLDTGQPIADELIQLGLAPNWVSEFKTAIDAFEGRLSDRRAGRYGVSAARAAIKAALAEGSDAIRTLDVIVAITLKNDPVLMTAWLRGRAIVEGRSKAQPEAVEAPKVAEPSATAMSKAS